MRDGLHKVTSKLPTPVRMHRQLRWQLLLTLRPFALIILIFSLCIVFLITNLLLMNSNSQSFEIQHFIFNVHLFG